MDQAALAAGCDWNLGAHSVVAAGTGLSKWYGSLTDNANGCGIVYWNNDRQAAYFMPWIDTGINVANASQGATTYASSTYSTGTPASSVIDGNRSGTGWGSGGGWSSNAYATAAAPQIITVQLNGMHTINAIDVVTLQDNYGSPVEPTLATTFTSYGIRDFWVQYYNGSTWTTVAAVAGNNHVVNHFTFPAVTATHVRVWITAAADGFARVVEISAYEPSRPTSRNILSRYIALGADTSVLGLPISNPFPYAWNGVTFQLFENGVMTFKRGSATAHFVGGTIPADPVSGAPAFDDRPLVGAWMRTFDAYPDDLIGTPIVYALTADAGCASSAASTACSSTTTGRFVPYADDYWNGTGYLVMKLGAAAAFDVSEPVAQQLGAYPWLHAPGYPLSDLTSADASGRYRAQTFEHGTMSWLPSYTASGAYTTCPATIASCTGAAGQVGCPVLYGTRYTNYLVQPTLAAWDSTCATNATVTGNSVNPFGGDVSYYIPPGGSQDFPLGSFKAGTTLEFGNCNGAQVSTGLSLTILRNGVPVQTTTGGCLAQGKTYATFSSRLGSESWVARLTCAGAGANNVPCTSTAHFATRYDFNGDLIDVVAAYDAIPTTTENASLIGLDDPTGAFGEPGGSYGCWDHDDHPEGIVRLPNNRFAITTDFGDNGILYLFDVATKPVDDHARLGTNIIDNSLSDADRLISENPNIGGGRGHLGGSTRSGVYLLTAAEADDDSVNGMISVIDTTGDSLRDVNRYTNSVLFNDNDGAAWVTSAKLGTGSGKPGAPTYIPPELQNAHLVISAGTNMGTINVAYAPKDQTSGLSTLTTDGIKGAGANFARYTTVASYGGDNQASLITQADGQVFLMTLNGDDNGSSTGQTDNSTEGYSKLYRVQFAACPNGDKICFMPTGGAQGVRYKTFQTASYVDMVRAAGTFISATGSKATEQLMVYGLWAAKVNSTHGDGCGNSAGPWLRAMEF